jgi:ABC-type Zn uptake system ZnuABC Zn-binding protein ZnuA
VIPNLSSNTGPTPKDLGTVIDLVKEHDIKVIFLENESSEKLSDSVAEETGIRVATGLSVETLTDGQTYVDFVNTNIQIIVSNLVE